MTSSTYTTFVFKMLLVALTALLFVRLGANPIYILDEAKNAQCAREMLQRGDWVVPTFNQELRTDKPPLHYYFMMLAYSLFGFTAFAARFFSAVAGVATVLVTYYYTKRHRTAFTAFCATLVLCMSSHFLFEFRLSVPDPYLIFFITLGLFSAYTWLQEEAVLQLYLAAMAFGLATLAKGPVALALPGFCLLAWIAVQKKWRTALSFHLLPALLLLCLIVLPWYLAVDKATNGAWTRGFFIEHNLNRFSDPQEGHGGFFLVTLLYVAIGLLPFMSFAGETFKQRRLLFSHPMVQFSGIVCAVFLVFFSLASTRLPNYPMPCYPFAAVILGHFIAGLLDGNIPSKKYPVYLLILFLCLIPVAGYFAIRQEAATAAIGTSALVLLAAPMLLILLLVTSKQAGWSGRIRAIAGAYTCFNLLGLQYVYPVLYSQNPVSKTIALLRREPVVFAYKLYNPGYNFYLPHAIPQYTTVDELRQAIRQHPGAIILSRKEYLDSLQTLPVTLLRAHHDLFELPTTVILKSHVPPPHP